MFARGAAWLPASTLVGSVTPARVHELVRLARDGNMTMLRVWGGGIYEQDAFYRATDELGVLVWHDFMFACTDYPSDDPTLRHEVTLEAEHQVRRLRNRASMALWCGNNEVHVLHAVAYQGIEPGGWGWDFFHRILPEAVAQHDGAVPYWPGSPYGEHEAEGFLAVNGVLDGDRHAWEVWHGLELGTSDGPFESVGRSRHYRRYAQDRGKFISEFGIHASPVLSTLERWIPSEALAVHSPSFDAHNKDHPKNKGDALLEIITGLPRTMAEYVDFTMVSQAEGLKFGIEHYRRRQPHCSGALVWQLNDVWPGFSWSVIDHDTVPKAGYHLVRRAFAPVLASLELADDRLSLWVSNSTATDAATTAVLTLAGLDGVTRVEERLPVRVPAGGSQVVWSRVLTAEERGADRYAWVESADGAFPANRLFFAEIKDLPLRRTPVRSTVERTGPTSARVTVTADAFVYLVRCTTPYPTARCSDNYLDLRAGDLRTITVTGLPADFDPADLVVGSYVGV
jgi:beta-mannosidase